jgi:hypothetical protein
MRTRTTKTAPGRLSRSAEIRALVPELPRTYRDMRVDRQQLAELLIDGLLTYAERYDTWAASLGNHELFAPLPEQPTPTGGNA